MEITVIVGAYPELRFAIMGLAILVALIASWIFSKDYELGKLMKGILLSVLLGAPILLGFLAVPTRYAPVEVAAWNLWILVLTMALAFFVGFAISNLIRSCIDPEFDL